VGDYRGPENYFPERNEKFSLAFRARRIKKAREQGNET